MLFITPRQAVKKNSLKIVLTVCLFIQAAFVLFSCSTNKHIQVPLTQKERIYYEIFTASFYDSNQDGIGDFLGIAKKLDYLSKDLGVSGIYLMPIMESPTYHKYDVTDYYKTDSSYGTLDDFKTLTALCKKQSLSVIIDLPINHSSSKNPWFIKACKGDEKYEDWYNFSETYKSGYHLVPSEYTNGIEKYYEGHFTSEMPDFNLDNKNLRDEILNICRFWMEAGVDGFRLDAVNWFYNANTEKNVEFLSWLMTELNKINSNVFVVGEAWTDGSVIADLYDSGITSLFNFPFSQSTGKIISCVRSGKGEELAISLEKWYSSLPSEAIDAPFLTNHDQARSSGALMGNLDLQKSAAAVYLLLPGSPFIYYGEEIGMQGGSGKDENKRTAMVWCGSENDGTLISQKEFDYTKNPVIGMCMSPLGADDIRPVSEGVKEQLKDKNSLLSYYKKVVALKNKYPCLSSGTFNACTSENPKFCAYTIISNDNQIFAVIHNLGDDEAVYDTASFMLKKNGEWTLLDYLSVAEEPVMVARTMNEKTTKDGIIVSNYKNLQIVFPAHSSAVLQFAVK